MKQRPTKIDIAKKIAPILSSRDVVRDLNKLIKKTKSNLVKLDFKKVDFVSRSAAHELLLLKERFAQQSKSISFINTNQEVTKMLRIVAANRALPLKKSHTFKAPIVSIKSLLKA